jgi:NAD(P)-dependent dehydrogenase (short-subunit alcohol dehydrogenase family)
MNLETRLSLRGKVAIVTGAGRGIGRAEAVELARLGAAVVVNDSVGHRADEVAAAIVAGGGAAIASHESVASPSGGEKIVETAVREYGTVDVLVNNAGILRCGYFEALAPTDITDVLQTNVAGAFHVSQPAWRVMQKQRYGRIVNTSSSSGMFAHQGLAGYAASKAALYGLTKALAYEGQPYGISVNAVLPFAETAMASENPVPNMDEQKRRYFDPEDARIAPRYDPHLATSLVTYLASSECEVTGETFSACLGRYGRVFVGVADGWLADEPRLVTAGAIAERFDEIRDVSRHTVPGSLFEELATVVERLPS